MASRNILDCTLELQKAWLMAKVYWETHYPLDPQPFLTCTYRSGAEQNELYAIGRTKPGKIVTHARAGASLHNSVPSRAFDVAFITLTRKLDWSPKLFSKLAEILEKEGVEWGGNFKMRDLAHFEKKSN